MRSEYVGNVGSVRAVEDAIRATRKYTEFLETMRKAHPIQGEEYPSLMFSKRYEVYPDREISWDTPMGKAIQWLWGDTECIYVTFRYDYRVNKATLVVLGGPSEVKRLVSAIPSFNVCLAGVIACGKENIVADDSGATRPVQSETGETSQTMGATHRHRVSSTTNP
jgi:hypothetical protein